MPMVVFDLAITVIILGMTYALVSEGLWGAVLMCFNVFFSTLIALNFYEPLARLVAENASFMNGWADLTCLFGIWLVCLVLLRVITETAAPTMVRYPSIVYNLGRIAFGFLGAVIATAFLLLCFHVAPVNKKIFNRITYDTKNPFGQAIDRKLLAFFQYSTGHIFTNWEEGLNESDPEFKGIRVFDPKGSWLIDHQNARIGSEGAVPDPTEASSGSTGGGEPADGGETGGTPSAGGNRRDDGPGVPGGTAGAAAGLAPTR